MNRHSIALALLGALALAPLAAPAAESGTSLEEVMAQEADTKAEHMALAQFYAEKAEAARSLAQRHHAMHRAYLGGKAGNKQAFVDHCQRIAKDQEAIAKEYDGLAKLHEQAASQAAK